jgi:hypothetical protein
VPFHNIQKYRIRIRRDTPPQAPEIEKKLLCAIVHASFKKTSDVPSPQAEKKYFTSSVGDLYMNLWAGSGSDPTLVAYRDRVTRFLTLGFFNKPSVLGP